MTQRINIEEPRITGLPVVKRTALGQTFIGAVVKAEPRDRMKMVDGTLQPIVKASGKHAQELVVTCLVLPGTNAPAGLGDEEGVPEPGALVRLILKGKSFGDWIESKKSLPNGAVAVGDVVAVTTDVAQVYDAQGQPSGGEIRSQSQIDAARQKGRSVGIYGPLTLAPYDEASEWTTKAIAAYREMQTIPAEGGNGTPATPAAAPVAASTAPVSAPANAPIPDDPPAGIDPAAWKVMPQDAKQAIANVAVGIPNK